MLQTWIVPTSPVYTKRFGRRGMIRSPCFACLPVAIGCQVRRQDSQISIIIIVGLSLALALKHAEAPCRGGRPGRTPLALNPTCFCCLQLPRTFVIPAWHPAACKGLRLPLWVVANGTVRLGQRAQIVHGRLGWQVVLEQAEHLAVEGWWLDRWHVLSPREKVLLHHELVDVGLIKLGKSPGILDLQITGLCECEIILPFDGASDSLRKPEAKTQGLAID
mmetsp:Transcript_894/g.1787  ORF Transcript_894/g.1787 Transcript_894/m.1787 type:complete len:220 (+) Transcript_894:574-1233(+)